MPSFSAVHEMGGTLADNPGTQRRAKARRYRRMAKKPSGRNRRKTNPMGDVQYGVRVPRNVKEALELDRINKNTMWADSIKKELEAMEEMLADILTKPLPKKRFEYLRSFIVV